MPPIGRQEHQREIDIGILLLEAAPACEAAVNADGPRAVAVVLPLPVLGGRPVGRRCLRPLVTGHGHVTVHVAIVEQAQPGGSGNARQGAELVAHGPKRIAV